MDGMSVSSGNGTTTPVFDKVNGVPVFLDSGGTLSQLPTYVVKELLKSFPSAKKSGKVYTVECPARDSKMTIDFKFGNTTVYAPVNDFIWRSGKYCILGAFENDSEYSSPMSVGPAIGLASAADNRDRGCHSWRFIPSCRLRRIRSGQQEHLHRQQRGLWQQPDCHWQGSERSAVRGRGVPTWIVHRVFVCELYHNLLAI